MAESIQLKKSHLYIGLGIIILIAIFFFKGGLTGNAVSNNGDYQKVVIDMKNWEYNPSTIKVKANTPVRLYLSNNVQGCFRDLTLPELGITKYLAGPNDYIETSFEKGTYTFACSMFMGQGKIIAN